jgi:biotin transporter BioY
MDDTQIDYAKITRNVSAGIYGWRKRCLYCLLIILTLTVVINLCLTLWLSIALGLHWVCGKTIVQAMIPFMDHRY